MRHPPQEPDRIAGRPVAGVVAGVVAATALAVAAAYGIGRWRARELGVERVPSRMQPQLPSEVNAMETRPFAVQAQGVEARAAADRWLSSYGWVDRGQQLVHVPIDAAIELYLARQGQPAVQP